MLENRILFQKISKTKKLVLILATFTLVTKAKKENKIVLKRVLSIYYLFYFWKNMNKISTLLDLSSKINIIMLAYVLKLDFTVYYINIKAQKLIILLSKYLK